MAEFCASPILDDSSWEIGAGDAYKECSQEIKLLKVFNDTNDKYGLICHGSLLNTDRWYRDVLIGVPEYTVTS